MTSLLYKLAYHWQCTVYWYTRDCFTHDNLAIHFLAQIPVCMEPRPAASQHAVAQLQTQIVHLEDAHGLLDSAVAAAMRNSKPVYISVCCNLAGEVHPAFAGESLVTYFSCFYACSTATQPLCENCSAGTHA